MSWAAILGLAAGAYAFKILGIFGLARVRLDGWGLGAVQLLPAALLSALVALQLFESGGTRVLATRLLGVAVGALAAWRRAPLIVVILVAAATTAAVRALF